MGNHLTTISGACCIERERDELVNLDSEDFDKTNASTTSDELKASNQTVVASNSEDELKAHPDELKAQLNAIVNAIEYKQSQDDLQAQINAVVQRRKQPETSGSSGDVYTHEEPCEQSPSSSNWQLQESPDGWSAGWQSPAAWSSDCELQDQIHAIVGAHSKSLKQQRLSSNMDASPSPAKPVLSGADFESFARLAVSQAKERKTPAKSPPPPLLTNWAALDDEIAPCQLSFAGCGDTLEAPKECADPKAGTRTFNVSDIPSPTRGRAKKELWADVEVEETTVDAQQKTAEEQEAEQKAAEEEEAATLKQKQARWLREMQEKDEMVSMDKVCVETFLESVKKCAWRERVRTPIKGSNLYTKHIRPCRPAGVSVDVKDSSFRNLGSFMQFLEGEGLLWLQPGQSDPVVTEINFNACRRYKYDAQRNLYAIKEAEAPHEAGCACRLCLPCATNCQ